MHAFVIEGGSRLGGTVTINGSKNAALPQLTACLLTDHPIELLGIPALADIDNMLKLLGTLGVEVSHTPGPTGRTVKLGVSNPGNSHAAYDIVRTMRASVSTLGPLLARRGYARVSMPGGCAIGDRPIDLHLRGLAALGAEITLEAGDVVAKAPRGRLKGAKLFLGGPFGPTVLGTANIMSAATLAEGVTEIESAACEPEIVDLAKLLNAMGAHIKGAGTPRIIIEGVKELGSASQRVMPDRIEAGTYMMAAAITNGQVRIENCPLDSLMAACDVLRRIGVSVREVGSAADGRATVEVTCGRVLHPAQVTTQPHPGFPTDLQAQVMALLTLADGNSIITERIYPERFLHVPELSRMGARIVRHGSTAVVSGVRELIGAPVMASDLRASAGLVLAGLAAKGQTIVRRVYHLDRGYEKMEERLAAMGANIERVRDEELGKTSDA